MLIFILRSSAVAWLSENTMREFFLFKSVVSTNLTFLSLVDFSACLKCLWTIYWAPKKISDNSISGTRFSHMNELIWNSYPLLSHFDSKKRGLLFHSAREVSNQFKWVIYLIFVQHLRLFYTNLLDILEQILVTSFLSGLWDCFAMLVCVNVWLGCNKYCCLHVLIKVWVCHIGNTY